MYSRDSLTFSLATAADAEALAGLVNAAYRGTKGERGWTSEAHLLGGQRIDPSMVADLLQEPDSGIILLHIARRLKGCVHVKRLSPTHAYLGLFAIRPDSQGLGLGGRLMAYAERWARDRWRISVIEITVIPLRRELVAWYRRLAYQATGETRPFPYGDPRFGVAKRDDLVLGVMRKTLTEGDDNGA